MGHDTNKRLLMTIIALGIVLFYIDLYLPIGIGIAVLYGGLVILSFLFSNRKGPLITAIVCSALCMSNIMFKSSLPGVPLWMGVSIRVFDLSAIWLPLLFYLHQRKTEDLLRLAHDELETRVQARTHELATVNQSLTQEIAERMEIEASLRTSEALSQASQQELRESRTELRALAGQLLTAQEEDRRRISRDLHDDINQRLAMLSMDLRRMEKGPSSNLEPLRDKIRQVSDGLTAVSDDVRQMAYRFHPSSLEDLGLVKAVRRVIEDFSDRTGIQYNYVHKDPLTTLSPEVTICVYRVVQESLSNISRHAQASYVEIELICEDSVVSLSIRDNGVGFDTGHRTQKTGHLGLLSMNERVRMAKGMFKVESTPMHGTQILVDIPLDQGELHA
jgi:signal transduction histidine kinase